MRFSSSLILGPGAAPNGRIHACGYFTGARRLHLAAQTLGNDGYDGFVLRTTKTATTWVVPFAGAEEDVCNGLAVDPSDQVVIAIGYQSFGLSIDTHALPNPTMDMPARRSLWPREISSVAGSERQRLRSEFWSVAILLSGDVLGAASFRGTAALGDGMVTTNPATESDYLLVRRQYQRNAPRTSSGINSRVVASLPSKHAQLMPSLSSLRSRSAAIAAVTNINEHYDFAHDDGGMPNDGSLSDGADTCRWTGAR